MLSSINAGVLVLHKTPIASWVTEGFVNISTENGFLSYELQSKNIFLIYYFYFCCVFYPLYYNNGFQEISMWIANGLASGSNS